MKTALAHPNDDRHMATRVPCGPVAGRVRAARRSHASAATAVHDPTDPIGRLLFNVLAMIANLRPTSAAFERGRA